MKPTVLIEGLRSSEKGLAIGKPFFLAVLNLQPSCCTEYFGFVVCVHVAVRHELRPKAQTPLKRGQDFTVQLLHAAFGLCRSAPK